jgi:hypothetical protein
MVRQHRDAAQRRRTKYSMCTEEPNEGAVMADGDIR